MSENLHAVAQQNNRPFVQVAAWIKRRTYRSRTFETFAALAPMAGVGVSSPVVASPHSGSEPILLNAAKSTKVRNVQKMAA